MTGVGARNLLISLVTVIVPSLWLARVAPRPVLKDYTSKLAAFEADPVGFNVIVIGSSRIHRGFVPSVFDELMASHGVEVRSFNFGLPGSSEHEWNVLLPEIIARAKRPLEWVVVELNPAEENYDCWQISERLTHWHTPQETVSALRSVALAELPFAEKLELYRKHIEFGLMHNFNLGRGPKLIDHLFGHVAQVKPNPGRGWTPYGESQWTKEQRRESFLKKLNKFAARSREARGTKLAPLRDSYPPELIDVKVRQIESAGAQAVFVSLMPLSIAPNFKKQRKLSVLKYNNPARLPEFFVPKNFHDAQHYSTLGAHKFTRMLARDMLRLGKMP